MKVTLNGWPVSAPFANVDSSHLIRHKGIDFAIPVGTPIPSISNGVVISVNDEGTVSFGKSIHIHMNDGTDVIYGHLSRFNVKVGQTIHTGDIIGFSGSTGNSTGPHLHLQVMKNGVAVDPSSYIHAINSLQGIPWWDLKDQALAAGDAFTAWLRAQLYQLCVFVWHGILHGLDVALPTLTCVGIIWYMVPFFPKHEKGAKLTGTSLLAYLFFVLIRGAYQ